MPSHDPPTLLTIPCELRNTIYTYIFDPSITSSSSRASAPSHSIAELPPLHVLPELKYDLHAKPSTQPPQNPTNTPHRLAPLLTNRQIHTEAHLLALSLTPFHLAGDITYPDLFALRTQHLPPPKLAAIRHLTLTARISHLQAMNETWMSQPFGHPTLRLETLTLLPRRPDASHSAYAEVADLSQSHTLAYCLAETFKGLRNVRCVEVRNVGGCFKDVVWRIVYRSLVYRLWRWGGTRCGVRFECGGEGEGGWFRVYFGGGERGVEVGEEVIRLAGLTGELPEPGEAGVGP